MIYNYKNKIAKEILHTINYIKVIKTITEWDSGGKGGGPVRCNNTHYTYETFNCNKFLNLVIRNDLEKTLKQINKINKNNKRINKI